jgi:hypothetical protein
MMNLQLVQYQPRWRVWLVATFARIVGVLIHVEGIPFGSSRNDTQRGETARENGNAQSLQQGATNAKTPPAAA